MAGKLSNGFFRIFQENAERWENPQCGRPVAVMRTPPAMA
jgi:hypothetical protein